MIAKSGFVGYPTREHADADNSPYDATVGMEKQLTQRGSKNSYGHVTELEDGRIICNSRVLVSFFEISKNILSMMDSSAKNLKKGRVLKPVDPSSFSPEYGSMVLFTGRLGVSDMEGFWTYLAIPPTSENIKVWLLKM